MSFPSLLEKFSCTGVCSRCNESAQLVSPGRGEGQLPGMDPSGDRLRDFLSGLSGNLVPLLRGMLSPTRRVAGPQPQPRGRDAIHR